MDKAKAESQNTRSESYSLDGFDESWQGLLKPSVTRVFAIAAYFRVIKMMLAITGCSFFLPVLTI